MNRTRKAGLAVLLLGIAINLFFSSEIAEITGAVIIGLGIGVALTGRFGKN